MIDLLSLGITHALLMIAAWRMVRRPELDRDRADAATPTGFGQRRPDAALFLSVYLG